LILPVYGLKSALQLAKNQRSRRTCRIRDGANVSARRDFETLKRGSEWVNVMAAGNELHLRKVFESPFTSRDSSMTSPAKTIKTGHVAAITLIQVSPGDHISPAQPTTLRRGAGCPHSAAPLGLDCCSSSAAGFCLPGSTPGHSGARSIRCNQRWGLAAVSAYP
jgi:hypothetical protein